MATKNIAAKTGIAAAAAAAAAAAGAYWLYGSADATKHRKQAKSWMLKARAEVMDAVEKLQDVDRKQYFNIVDSVARSYAAAAGGVQSPQLRALISDLRGAWRHIQSKPTSRTRSSAKKPANPRKTRRRGSRPSPGR